MSSMNRERLRFLQSPRGEIALARANALGVNDSLSALSALRREFTPDEAAAAVELVQLRERAAPKFSDADRLYFEREALEQSSGEAIARWRARRFVGHDLVADLCCGLGGDALALTETTRVVAVDCDRRRLDLLRANARRRGVSERVMLVEGAVPSVAPRVTAAFVDPSRRHDVARSGERRRGRSLEQMSPPLSSLLDGLAAIPGLGIKLSPALDDAELAAALGERPHEVEFISHAGECREAVLWLGDFVTATRRVTVLPAGETRAIARPSSDRAPTAPPGRYLYDPDPAIVRGHMVGLLGAELGAWQLHPEIAYLSADRLTRTPLASSFEVRATLPFHLKRVRAALVAGGYGDVIVKKRGFPMEPEALRRELRPHLRGNRGPAVLFVARVERGHLAIVTERVGCREEFKT